jgi:hypothetical protein
MHFVAWGGHIRYTFLLEQYEADVAQLKARLREAVGENEQASLRAAILERKLQLKREQAALSRILFSTGGMSNRPPSWPCRYTSRPHHASVTGASTHPTRAA